MVSHYRSPAEDSTVLKFKVWGGKGWCSGESACLPPMWPGVEAMCGLSLLLVLSFVPRGFSPGIQVFPSPQKPAFELGRRRTTLWMCYLQIVIIIIIIIIIIINTIIKCGHRTVYTAGFLKTLPPNQSSIFSSVK